MPGIEELKKFRDEIASLGDERAVVEARGEIYEELPLPQESSSVASDVSAIDVDDLLASITADAEKQNADGNPFDMLRDEPAEAVSPAPASPQNTDFSDIPLDADIDGAAADTAGDSAAAGGFGTGSLDADFGGGSASDDDLAALDAMLSSLPIGEASDLQNPDENPDAAPEAPLDGVSAFSAPEMPETPEMPAAPESPESFDMPEMPEMSGLSATEPFGLSDIPDMPDLSGFDGLDNMPGESEIPGGAEDFGGFSMPDLSDFSSGADSALDTSEFEDGTEKADASDADVVSIADTDGTPESAKTPELPDFPETASDSSASFADEGADSFSMPDLSDMPDMPDVPEMPDLSAFDGLDNAAGSDFSMEDALSGDADASPLSAGDAPAQPPEVDFNFDSSLDEMAAAENALAGDSAPSEPDGMEGLGDLGDLDGLADRDEPAASSAGAEPEAGAAADEGSAQEEYDGLQDLDGFDFDESVLNAAIRNSAAENVQSFSDFEKGDASKKGRGKSAKKEIPTELTEDEFERFLSLLSRFPLNLRLAVEEYLASEEGPELQKMELVHDVLTGVPLRKIANALEKHLSRSISIPKDFEKKNFEEYELEKSSLKYVFFNKVLPLATISTIITLLAACVVFLSYQFVYRPVSAEGLYKRGYQAIQEERYPQSLELFDRAVERWEKKRWYFTFARGYREKNQYISAETIYTRLLDRYDNDLKGGLEYAEMLRTDLRNFEKAETILRRRVLDYHINNLDGLLLLGDVFLDWAEENPEKYEQARLQYATAVDIYGRKDPILVRMMRYFIRTNNLAEVLPLKDHFMGKRAKIGAEDLIELGGYLLEKRYMPTAGDSDVLRDEIGDLREILERGVRADATIPEGHYNLGRFFIFNYNESAAAVSLDEALRLFPNLRMVSPRRVVTHVDAFRLLGEIRANEMEYIHAKELYAQGISLYENRRETRSVPQDARVGRLYADFADIDYFISNDWDSALHNYSKAVAELYDTPSVRYRIGYIHYQRRDYENALASFVRSYSEENDDSNLLFSLGNTLFSRGSYNAARGYYERLMEMSEAERIRKGVILPQVRSDHGAFVEQYMHAANNLGVSLYNISLQTGMSDFQGRAYSLFSESARAWDALTRNPDTMIRAQGTNLAYLNMRNISAPTPDFLPEIYADIAKTLEGEKVLRSRVD